MKAIRHIGIVVSDIDKALHFYRDLLGLTIEKDMLEQGPYIDRILNLHDVSVRTVKMAADDGNLVELLHFKSHSTVTDKIKEINVVGCSHVAFTVENLDEVYQRLLNEDIIFNSPPQYSPDDYAKVAFCKDPDGTLIELVEVIRKE
jgi:catechol 2,3-dioxygenase-like lactoylglutathione lyase family enzyme